MPITATLAMVAAAAMAGVPLLNGFLSKEMFFAETIFAGESAAGCALGCPPTATIAGMFSVAYSLAFHSSGVLWPAVGRVAAHSPRPHPLDAGCPARCS